MPMMNTLAGNQSFGLNPMLFTQMMQPQIKQELPMPNPSSGMFLSLIAQQQNMQPSLQAMSDQNMISLSNANLANQNLSNMNLAQMIKLKNQNTMMNQMTNTPKINENQKPETSIEQNQSTDIKEFQSKLFNLILTQNKILMELKEKNDLLQDALKCLITEVATLKR